ncbi:MAG TPA: DUF2231 domain-containing protein [Polyangia bacterium]|jgi:uncharacterized membrane protein
MPLRNPVLFSYPLNIWLGLLALCLLTLQIGIGTRLLKLPFWLHTRVVWIALATVVAFHGFYGVELTFLAPRAWTAAPASECPPAAASAAVVPTALAADASPPPPGGAVGDVDTAARRPRFWDLVGRYHPALVHLPLAWLLLLGVIDFMGLVLGREEWRRWGYYTLVFVAVSVVPTVITGLLRARYMNADEITAPLIVIHRTLNLIVAGAVLAALVIRVSRRGRLSGAARIAYLLVVFAAVVLVIISGSYGGRIVYGPDFVPF